MLLLKIGKAAERRFAEAIGAQHAVAVSSCTSALHLAYLASGFRRNAVTSAYERLIADGFAVATVGSGTFVAARIPATRMDPSPPSGGAGTGVRVSRPA